MSAARTGAQPAAVSRQPVLARQQIAQVRTIPNVIGKPVKQAISDLSSTGLTLVLIDSITSAVDAGTVLAQRPRAGTPVSRAKVESLWVSQARRRLRPDIFVVDPNRLTPKSDTTIPPSRGDDVHVPTDTVVPNLVGTTGQMMVALLRRATLKPGRSSRDYSDEQPVGRVYQQRPVVGTRVPIGSPVDVWFSIGPHPTPDTVRVPTVLKLTPAQADSVLRDVGLVTGRTERITGKRDNGTIIHQEPHPDALAHRGDQVHVTVVEAAPRVHVPHVVGQPPDTAESRVRERGLVIGSVATRPTSDTAPVVVEQSPDSGPLVAVGTAVHLVISRLVAPPEVRVPGLLRLTRGQTERALDSAGLTLGNVAVAGEEAAATVTAQDPVAGTLVLPGSPVDITLGTVSSDDTLYRIPHVIALGLDSASALIRQAGFSSIAVSGALPGPALVDSQTPRGGTLARPTTLITLFPVPVPLVDVPRLLDLTESVAEVVALRHGLFDSVRTRNRAFRLREAVVFQNPASGRVASGSVIAIDVETPVVPPPVLVATAGMVLVAGAGLTVRRLTKRPDPPSPPVGVSLAAVVTEPTSPTFILPDPNNSLIEESVRLRYLVEQTYEPLVVDNDSLIDPET